MYKKMRTKVSLTTAMLLTFSYISFGSITLRSVEASPISDRVSEKIIGPWDVEQEIESDSNLPVEDREKVIEPRDEIATSAAINIAIKAVEEIKTDVNGDSYTNVGDLGIVAKYHGYSSDKDGWELVEGADVNGDGKINKEDLILVAKGILGNQYE